MILEGLVVGEMEGNCYVLGCETTRDCGVIDPGAEVNRILSIIKKFALHPRFIINTHGHIDHMGGNRELKEVTGAEILIHKEDALMLGAPHRNFSIFVGRWVKSPPPDRSLVEGDIIKIGEISLTVLHTPGHSPGGISLLGDGFVFSGDTLFAESVGRTDLPGGSEQELFKSIREKLLILRDETKVYPGHGPISTIGEIKRVNPFVNIWY